MLEWNDAKDISWYYVQKCDGLSRATSARSGRATDMSSRAARVRNATRLSEATRRVVKLRSHGEAGCITRGNIIRGDEM